MRTTSARIGLAGVAVATVAALAACSLPGIGQDDSPADSPAGQDDPDGQQPAANWRDQAAAIDDIELIDVDTLSAEHVEGTVPYDLQPPAGGPHNDYWQDCTGVVYDAPIASEHAVHSLEHGAVWITHHPSLPADQVEQLAALVTGVDYTLMSPFEDLYAPVSLQAWGYRLAVQDAEDPRVEEFIRLLRTNAGPEAGRATCGGPNAVTSTGTTPTVP